MRRPFFVVGTEVGRYALLRRLLRFAPIAFLFSRITGPAVLNNKTREQIYLHIQNRPGAYFRSMKRELQLNDGTLTHHLHKLERENLIRRQREGLRLRFFATSIGSLGTRALNTWQSRLLDLVHAKPGISQTEVAQHLGMSRQALHYHVDLLRQAALIGVALVGRETRLAISDEVWKRVGKCNACGTGFVADPRAGQLRCPVCSAEILSRNAPALSRQAT